MGQPSARGAAARGPTPRPPARRRPAGDGPVPGLVRGAQPPPPLPANPGSGPDALAMAGEEAHGAPGGATAHRQGRSGRDTPPSPDPHDQLQPDGDRCAQQPSCPASPRTRPRPGEPAGRRGTAAGPGARAAGDPRTAHPRWCDGARASGGRPRGDRRGCGGGGRSGRPQGRDLPSCPEGPEGRDPALRRGRALKVGREVGSRAEAAPSLRPDPSVARLCLLDRPRDPRRGTVHGAPQGPTSSAPLGPATDPSRRSLTVAPAVPRVRAAAFDGTRLRAPGLVVVGFLADWCPYCVRFLPELARLLDEGRAVVCADLSDEDDPLWERFSIEIVPTVLVFRDGREVFRASGVAGVGLSSTDLRSVREALARLDTGPTADRGKRAPTRD